MCITNIQTGIIFLVFLFNSKFCWNEKKNFGINLKK